MPAHGNQVVGTVGVLDGTGVGDGTGVKVSVNVGVQLGGGGTEGVTGCNTKAVRLAVGLAARVAWLAARAVRVALTACSIGTGVWEAGAVVAPLNPG